MSKLKLREIIDLVVSDVPDAESRIQKVFEWHFQKEIELTKWALGGTVTLLVALFGPFSKDELKLVWWVSGAAAIGAMIPAVIGVARLLSLRKMHKEYFAALKLYRELKVISPFLSRYRSEVR